MSLNFEDVVKYEKMLHHADSSVRREAVERLEALNMVEAVPHITRSLMDENKGVQQAAADALINIGGKEVVQGVMPLLWDGSPARRNLAIEVLEVVGGDGKELIIESLKDEDADVRKFAVDILGVVGGEDVVDPLIEMLKDSNPNVRAATAEALGKVEDQKAIEPLINMLGDEEWVRFSVVEALSTIGDKKVVPHLLKALKETGAVQFGIVEALGQLKDSDAVSPLLDLMADSDSGVRNLSMKAVMEITEGEENVVADKVGKERFVQYLVESTEDISSDVKKFAIKGLATIGDPMSAGVVLRTATELDLQDEESVVIICEALEGINSPEALLAFLGTKDIARVNEEDEPLLEIVINVLGRIGKESTAMSLSNVLFKAETSVKVQILNALQEIGSEKSQEKILEALQDKNGRVRRSAASALGNIKNNKSLDSLCLLIEKEKFPDVIERIIKAIVSIGGERAFQRLTGFTQSETSSIREAACWGLGLHGQKQGVNFLIQLLDDSDWKVQKSAINSLVDLGYNDDISLLQPLLMDENNQVRGAVVALIASYGDERILSPLLKTLYDSDMMVRFKAAEALGALGGEEVFKALLNVIEKDNVEARIGAVKALGIMKRKDAVEQIKKLLSDDNEIMRSVAAEALQEIEG